MQKSVKKMNFDKIKEENKEIIEKVGTCPLSTNDVIEALKEGECFCIDLKIKRPSADAVIADPTRLGINKVLFSFMQGDSFLDSAAYSIDKDADAHGGFGNKQAGKLAEGAGREEVSGVMPLYLFKEHWEVAKKRSPPIYGLMCTLDRKSVV